MSTNNEFKFVQFDQLDEVTQKFIKESVRMMEFAYCPYSNFQVGAIVETTNGNQYTGCNVENIGHTPAICAERTAIAKAVSCGDRELAKVAVSAVVKEPNVISPCGVCRQVIKEFCPKDGDVTIYLTTPRLDKVMITSLNQLLPYSFPM
ncbi:hypothetical protein O3M35_002655 [Rhynocoris fuscipes]|uniref:Cytidine deaminase n=1 Tax=Rhynocoris fuscipes TaxID=488301 RepID=A0AAW1CL20_9HEMI